MPSTWLEDLVAVLVAAGVGTFDTDIFASTKATITRPSPGAAVLVVIETGGTGPEMTHNRRATAAYRKPGAQLTASAASYAAAKAMAEAAYAACIAVTNKSVGAGPTWYRKIRPLQEPFDLGLDEKGNARCAFNVLADKR